MALIWQKKVSQADGSLNDYQIRTAGKSLRLYRNKVFHTQYHPERIVTGDIWELLLLASLNIPKGSRVLVLGAGGGAIVNLLQYFVSPKHIDVIDLDPTILYLCNEFFLSQKNNVNLIASDAKCWLENQSKAHQKYDLIIEDLFGEEKGQPIKAFPLDKSWLTLLSKHLSKSGRLVINFESSKELMCSPAFQTKGLLTQQGFLSFIRFSSPRYQNNIALFARSQIYSADIREQILKDKLLSKYNSSYYMRAFN